mgnify:CR=1 FL=1
MEQTIWNVELDGATHEVRLDWTYFGGRREVFVDGVQRHVSVIPMRWRSTQEFEIDGHPCVVATEPSSLISPYFRISLRVDGRVVEAETPKSKWER